MPQMPLAVAGSGPRLRHRSDLSSIDLNCYILETITVEHRRRSYAQVLHHAAALCVRLAGRLSFAIHAYHAKEALWSKVQSLQGPLDVIPARHARLLSCSRKKRGISSLAARRRPCPMAPRHAGHPGGPRPGNDLDGRHTPRRRHALRGVRGGILPARAHMHGRGGCSHVGSSRRTPACTE